MRVSIVLFHLILILLMLLSFNVGSSSCCCTNNLIEEICKKFAKEDPDLSYNFCRYSLQAAPGSRCADRQELGLMSLRLIQNNATDTQCYIKQQLLRGKKGLINPITNSSLDTCLGLYSLGLYDLKDAIKFYISGEYSRANMAITSISWSATRCNDHPMIPPPLKNRNDDVFRLSSIGLAFTYKPLLL